MTAGPTTVNSVLAGNSLTSVLVGSNGTSVAIGHTLFDKNGVAIDSSNPLVVSDPAAEALLTTIAAASGGSTAGGATAAKQPALNADGGGLAHITNFPASQVVTLASLPLPAGAATAAAQPALNADGGSLAHITNFPTSQAVTFATLPAGTNTIGAVTQAAGPWAVSWSGQSVAATQDGTWTVALATGSAVSITGSVGVTGTFWQATQPVSATALPLPAGAATAAAQPALNADGGALAHITNLPTTQAVSLASLPALPAGTNAIGTVGVTGTVAVSASALPLPAGAATAANQAAINADGGAQSHVMNFPATQAITASALPLPSGAATAAKQDAIIAAVQAGATLAATTTQSAALEGSHVLKSAAGNLYSVYVTTGATAGYLMTFDAIAAPADGAVTPKQCIYCPAQSTTVLEYPVAMPEAYGTGITAVFSSTGPFTKTASTTAFIQGRVV